jgi:hypothetical protein
MASGGSHRARPGHAPNAARAGAERSELRLGAASAYEQLT